MKKKINHFKRIIFRADGNGEIGYGHLTRLNALADIISPEFKVTFLTRHDSNISLIGNNIEIVIIPKEIGLNDEIYWIYKKFTTNNNLIIADGYQFNTSYQKKIKNLGYKLIFIDDLVKFHMYADIVINHAIGLDESHYSGEKYVKYYLGSKYALLRNSFIEVSKSRVEKTLKFETAFVSFGGTNVSRIIRCAVEALIEFESFKRVIVVIGKSFSSKDVINFFSTESKIELFREVDEKEISKLMQRSDFAIVPSSTISYELACSRCIIASGYTVQNQFHIYEGLKENNIVFGMGDISNFVKEDFQYQIKKIVTSKIEVLESKLQSQINYFDGNQKERLLNIVNSLK